MKDALYFSHDSNARHDPKITAMRGVYGSEGYGWYWMLIEMMREAEGYKLDMHSKYAFNAYAMQLQCERIAIESFVHDCIEEFDLFNSDGQLFWSESLLARMKIKDEKSRKAKESANARWKKNDGNANASNSNANASKNDAYKKGNKGKEINIQDMSDSNECELMFEQFYNIYTPKQGSVRKEALKSWNRLWKANKINASNIGLVIESALAYLSYQKSKKLNVCGAQVFLNQERWLDQWESSNQKESATTREYRADEAPDFVPAEPPTMF